MPLLLNLLPARFLLTLREWFDYKIWHCVIYIYIEGVGWCLGRGKVLNKGKLDSALLWYWVCFSSQWFVWLWWWWLSVQLALEVFLVMVVLWSLKVLPTITDFLQTPNFLKIASFVFSETQRQSTTGILNMSLVDKISLWGIFRMVPKWFCLQSRVDYLFVI